MGLKVVPVPGYPGDFVREMTAEEYMRMADSFAHLPPPASRKESDNVAVLAGVLSYCVCDIGGNSRFNGDAEAARAALSVRFLKVAGTAAVELNGLGGDLGNG